MKNHSQMEIRHGQSTLFLHYSFIDNRREFPTIKSEDGRARHSELFIYVLGVNEPEVRARSNTTTSKTRRSYRGSVHNRRLKLRILVGGSPPGAQTNRTCNSCDLVGNIPVEAQINCDRNKRTYRHNIQQP